MMRFIALLIFISLFIVPAKAQNTDPGIEMAERESVIDANDAAKIVDDIENFLEKEFFDISEPSINVKPHLPADSVSIKPLIYTREQKWWWNLVKQGKLNMKDTTVIYPKFIKFCVEVYNWADETFNSYDPEYVEGTGKRWKVRLVNDNWVDSYSMTLPGNLHTWMMSNVYSNIGAYIQYMAVSVGSSYDIGKLFHHREPSHKKYEFGFNCARFNAELYYHENKGGTNLRKFGQYEDGKLFKEVFPGLRLYTLGFDAYYFFNNRRYSQGAAYNFSKIQKKSQGSFIGGFSFTNLKLSLDFNELPENLLPYLTISKDTQYLFHYNSYAVIFGYGFNWVIMPQLLFNVTALPSIGASHCYKDSLEGAKWLASLNIAGRISLTYNLGNYFFSIIGKMNGHWYKSAHHSLFNSIENFSANIGLRF